VTNRIRESRLNRDLVRRVSVTAVDVLKHQEIWRENLVRALLCLAPLFLMVFGLSGCDRRPVMERNASEPGGPSAAPMEQRASSIPSVHLLVDASEAMLFGAASGGRWLPAASAAPLTQEGMKYGLYTLTGRLGESPGEKAKPSSKSCSNPSVNIVDVPQLDADVIAVSANWNALPRTPRFTARNNALIVISLPSGCGHKGSPIHWSRSPKSCELTWRATTRTSPYRRQPAQGQGDVCSDR